MKKRGQRIGRCDQCLLPLEVCICSYRPKISTNCSFWILIHPLEVEKPTNTGRIVRQCLPAAELFVWDPIVIGETFLKMLHADRYTPYLIMPDDYAETQQRCVSYKSDPAKIPVFILLDGTWSQAKKMLKKSDYLDRLPILPLETPMAGHYELRKSELPHRLSTIETVIALLKTTNQPGEAELLSNYFNVFKYFYMTRVKNKISVEPVEEMRSLNILKV